MAIIEPILTVLGPAADSGTTSSATSSRAPATAPPTTPRATPTAPATARWVAVSTSAQSIAERVMRLVGRPELIDEPWFATGARPGRARRRARRGGRRLDRRAHDRDEVVAAFEKAEAAVAPIYDIRDVMADPQYQALGIDHRGRRTTSWAPIRMQNVLFRLSETPGAIRWAGRPHGADTDEVLGRARPDRRGDRRAARRGRAVSATPAQPYLPLTWLYVPGDRPDVVAKALACGADVVMVDLEDAVAPGPQGRTRCGPPPNSSEPHPAAGPVHVRVNALDGPLAGREVRALAALPGLAGLRLPKVHGARPTSTAPPAGWTRRRSRCPRPVRAAGVRAGHRARLRHRRRAPGACAGSRSARPICAPSWG